LIPYRELVESLMWAALATRPDLAYMVTTLFQFSENPGQIHWEAAKCVLWYLQGTKDLWLTYSLDKKSGLITYSDADSISQKHCHTISSFIFLLDGGAIS
jgi:hypothetical protein